ncbi:MAG: type IV toxin-antitoxin system AbiEi family antitoxin domain-containing protein [Candidatus Moranbacteria bacterium]|jgi:predicted transcriptional regulator of viral defense system|nr:type IV toxin-antitoxin system AbiEi family antitoxin domain-containing protein [Candidatus Moranbacteria bacterium]
MYIKELLKSEKTVFSVQDVATMFGLNGQYLRTVLTRLATKGDIAQITRGLYSVSGKQVNFLELANKLKKPSYVSLETVLTQAGVVFQDYGQTIFSVSDNSIEKNVSGKNFQYLKMKDSVLYNPTGIRNNGNYMAASLERAVCDRLYFSPGYYFDNIEKADPEKLLQLAEIYENKRLKKEVSRLVDKLKK